MPRPVRIAEDGWISVELDDDLRAHVHVTPRGVDRTGEIVIDGLYLEGASITTATFPQIHPARIVAAAYDCVVDLLMSAEKSPGGPTKEKRMAIEALFCVITPRVTDDAATTLGELRGRAKGRRIVERPREQLGRPVGDLDDFYRRVAVAYNSAGAASGRPAVVLAEENQVPVNTVHRWVKEARRRGHLTPGRQRSPSNTVRTSEREAASNESSLTAIDRASD